MSAPQSSMVAAGALAKFGKADMAALAQFQSGRDQYAVDIDAGLAFELKQHVDCSGIVGAAAQHPAAKPRIAPVRVWTSRPGSSMETAFICIAHGMLIVCPASLSSIFSLTRGLSETEWSGVKSVQELNGG